MSPSHPPCNSLLISFIYLPAAVGGPSDPLFTSSTLACSGYFTFKIFMQGIPLSPNGMNQLYGIASIHFLTKIVDIHVDNICEVIQDWTPNLFSYHGSRYYLVGITHQVFQ